MMFALLYIFSGALHCKAAVANREGQTKLDSPPGANNAEIRQQLVFGYDTKGGERIYWCDVKLTPNIPVEGVMIFAKTDASKDSAVAKHQVSPKRSPKAKGYFRLNIPVDIDKQDNVFTFEFSFSSRDSIFSEPWAYDFDKKTFSLVSGIKKKFYKQRPFIIAAIGSAALIVLVAAYFFMRSMKKSRPTTI